METKQHNKICNYGWYNVSVNNISNYRLLITQSNFANNQQ